MQTKKILVSGLGGGLDVVNASILYFALQVQGQHVDLGSVRPAPITTIETPNIKPFHAAGTIITASTEIKKKGRYIEPRLAQLLNTQVLFFSRNMETRQEESQLRPQQVQLLRDAITLAKETYKYDYMLFVDGGGDSLCLTSNDMNQGSQFVDPFLGGDAELLEATYTVPGTVIQAVISVGLDIDKQAFANHVKALAAMGGYLGRMNMKTGEQQDWKCPFQCNNTYLKSYFELADQVLILNEKHFNDANRLPSHTATVTYHALKGNYGVQRTYVPWEPSVADKKGVMVEPEHCWMYFFDAHAVHKLKMQLNGKL